jgi:hypothetical protein
VNLITFIKQFGACRAHTTEHEFRYNSRTHDAPDRIARCLIGQHGRLRLRELFA